MITEAIAEEVSGTVRWIAAIALIIGVVSGFFLAYDSNEIMTNEPIEPTSYIIKVDNNMNIIDTVFVYDLDKIKKL